MSESAQRWLPIESNPSVSKLVKICMQVKICCRHIKHSNFKTVSIENNEHSVEI